MISLHHGESVSAWMDTVQMPTFSTLLEDIDTEVCIVGGGLAGLTTAYLLLQAGKKVCVLEGFEIGSGQTGRTTAQLTTALDERYFMLEKFHGEKGARLAAESHSAAIKKVYEITRKENIDCDLEKINGYLFNSHDDPNYQLKSNRDKSHEYLNIELEAVLRAGLSDVYMTERVPLSSFDPGPALCFPDQLQLHPLKYLQGLAQAIIKKGGQIFTNSHVVEVQGGEAAFVRLQNDHIVSCDSIVVATNSPINDLVAIHTKQASYRSYVIGVEVPKGSIIKGLFWDTEDPYHYVRLEKNEDNHPNEVLLVGGEDHKTGQNDNPEHCYTRLENWTRKRFTEAGRVIYRWSGHVMEPVDGLAYIGHNPMDSDNVYVVTGHSGNGMTYSTIAGMLITDLILEKENPWKSLYNPSRISLTSAGAYLKENANTLIQYKDWLIEKKLGNLDSIKVGEGVVYRDGLQIVAAYKDDYGNLELNSAVCPHLGGIVHWNKAEKSWDCPCHGSRFDCHGKVIDGPAVSDLTLISSTPALHPPDVLKVWPDADANPVL
ncbi:MAG: FAD-dependent oxidoreductase [Bacteriovorax sp.]|nr:FAD-dependent oxidoreductase [Bacteriovorax sp.]